MTYIRRTILYPIEFVPGLHRENKKRRLKSDLSMTCLTFNYFTSNNVHILLYPIYFPMAKSEDNNLS